MSIVMKHHAQNHVMRVMRLVRTTKLEFKLIAAGFDRDLAAAEEAAPRQSVRV